MNNQTIKSPLHQEILGRTTYIFSRTGKNDEYVAITSFYKVNGINKKASLEGIFCSVGEGMVFMEKKRQEFSCKMKIAAQKRSQTLLIMSQRKTAREQEEKELAKSLYR